MHFKIKTVADNDEEELNEEDFDPLTLKRILMTKKEYL